MDQINTSIPRNIIRKRNLEKFPSLNSDIEQNNQRGKKIIRNEPKQKKVEYIKSFIKYFKRQYANKIEKKTSPDYRALWNTLRMKNCYNLRGLAKIFEQQDTQSSRYREWIISELTEAQLRKLCNQKHRSQQKIQQFENRVKGYLEKLVQIQSRYKQKILVNQDPNQPTAKQNKNLNQTSDNSNSSQYPIVQGVSQYLNLDNNYFEESINEIQS